MALFYAKTKLALLILFLCAACAGCQTRSPENVKAFVHVNVVPMDNEQILEDQTVVVLGDRIHRIGSFDQIRLTSGAMVIQGEGKYLLPGLADMHAHLETEEDALFLFIANGVTTIRNMWGRPQHLQWRSEIASGNRFGPAIFTTGPITDGDPPMWPESTTITTPDSAEAVLLAQKEAGYDAMKIMTNFSPGLYDAVLAAAKKHDFPVYGHVPLRVGLRKALGSGQRSFEHMQDFLYGLLPEDSPLWPRIMEGWKHRLSVENVRAMWLEAHLAVEHEDFAQLAAEAAASGRWICPTLVAAKGFFIDRADLDAYRRLPYNKYVPETRRRAWDASLEWQLANTSNVEKDKVAWNIQRRAVEALHCAGARLLAGTDTHPDMPYIVPGFSLHEELQHLVEVGLSPYEALKAATVEPAALLNKSKEFGTVEVGKRADLILVEADPLEDVANAARRAGVMVRGKWFTEAELKTKLDALAEAVAAKDEAGLSEQAK